MSFSLHSLCSYSAGFKVAAPYRTSIRFRGFPSHHWIGLRRKYHLGVGQRTLESLGGVMSSSSLSSRRKHIVLEYDTAEKEQERVLPRKKPLRKRRRQSNYDVPLKEYIIIDFDKRFRNKRKQEEEEEERGGGEEEEEMEVEKEKENKENEKVKKKKKKTKKEKEMELVAKETKNPKKSTNRTKRKGGGRGDVDEMKKEPRHWEDVWDAIEKMRALHLAPVDTLGCSSLADTTSPEIYRYHTLIGLMLSSQTKDPITAAAMANLKRHGLTVDNILQTDDDTLHSLIDKVGYHNKKVGYIKRTTQILKDKYNGDIPQTVEELIALPGVGPKMAYLAMQVAWKNPVGIGVDVHVHRISNRLGWVKGTKNPEGTRKELEQWLPEERWGPVNKLLVGFGQTICLPIGPKCTECAVSHQCPSAFKKK